MQEDHTGAIIALGLKDALSAWGLDEARLVCMTTDSGANMVRTLEINKWTRLACFGHRLHNAIGKLHFLNLTFYIQKICQVLFCLY